MTAADQGKGYRRIFWDNGGVDAAGATVTLLRFKRDWVRGRSRARPSH